MKVLLINNGYPSHRNPNYTTYIKSIEECLIAADAEVSKLVITYNKKINIFSKLLKHITFWITNLFYKINQDIVYVNHLPFSWTIIFNSNIKNKKVIVHWHGNELIGNNRFLRFTHNIIKPKINDFLHIVPSQYFRNKLIEKFPKIDTKKIYISPSGGVDTKLFKPSVKKEAQKIFNIGFAASLTKDKGADVLLELMKDTKEIELATGKKIGYKVINYGKEAEYYINQFNHQNEEVEIFSKMEKIAMPQFYNSISLLIMPSVREGESLGLVALEAMSCGTPVVTYNLFAFPEFIKTEESGELSEYSNDFMSSVDNIKKEIIKAIINYEKYHPRDQILNTYSKEKVSDFYRGLLNT